MTDVNSKLKLDLLSLSQLREVALCDIVRRSAVTVSHDLDALSTTLDLLASDSLNNFQRLVLLALSLSLSELYSIPIIAVFPFLINIFESQKNTLMLSWLQRWWERPDRLQDWQKSSETLLSQGISGTLRGMASLKIAIFDGLSQQSQRKSMTRTSYDFIPPFSSTPPSLLEPLEEEFSFAEVGWMGPEAPIWCPVLWEESPDDRKRRISSLVGRAITTALPVSEQDELVDLLSNNPPEDLFETFLSLEKTESMLRVNREAIQTVAVTWLRSSTLNTLGKQLLDRLLLLPVSSDSLELVQSLWTSRLRLPADFLSRYSAHAVTTCERQPDRRLVSWVSLFLHRILSEEPSALRDLFSVLQSFCMTFVDVKGCVGLYSLLRALNPDK